MPYKRSSWSLMILKKTILCKKEVISDSEMLQILSTITNTSLIHCMTLNNYFTSLGLSVNTDVPFVKWEGWFRSQFPNWDALAQLCQDSDAPGPSGQLDGAHTGGPRTITSSQKRPFVSRQWAVQTFSTCVMM